MKNRILLLLCFLIGLSGLPAAAQYDLWLLRIGDGDKDTMTSPSAYALQKVKIDGDNATLLETFEAPSTDPATLITGVPSYSTDGQLSMSHDGRFLVFTGYGAMIGQTGSIAGANASAVNRVVARFNTLTGEFDTSTRLTNSFNQSNFRGGTTYDGSGFWLTGNGSGSEANYGLRYAEFGSSESVTVLSGNYTTLDAVIFDGDLYFSRTTGSGQEDTTNSGILKAGGLPTEEGIVGQGVGLRLPSNDWENGGGYRSFQFSPDGTALFVASTGGPSGNAGVQVYRYDESDDLWNLTTVLDGSNFRHLEVFDADGDQVRIFYVHRETSGDFVSTLWSTYYDLETDQFTTPVAMMTADTGYVYYGVAGTDNPPVLDENMPLSIVSAASGVEPEVGDHFYAAGTEVTVSAPENVTTESGIEYRLLGWTADGSAPTSGSGSTITFNLEEPTTIEWLWEKVSAPNAPVIGWNLRGSPTGGVPEKLPSDWAVGVEPIPLTRGPGIEQANLNEGFAATGFIDDDTLDGQDRASAFARGNYFEFGFIVEDGHEAYLSSLDASYRRSAYGGPYLLEWQFSLDGFSTPGTPIVPNGKIWDDIGWTPNGSLWHSTSKQIFWTGAEFVYVGRNSTGDATVYRSEPMYYNYMLRDVTLQGAAGEPGNPMPTIDLRGISELQGIPAGTTVTFRLYAWGDKDTKASNSFAFGRQDGPVVGGAVAPVGKLPVTVISESNPGIHFYDPGTSVTLEAPATVPIEDGKRYSLAGWEGTGSAPAEGSGDSVTFTLNEPTTVEWIWKEESQMEVLTEGDGSVTLDVGMLDPVPLLGFDFGNYVFGDDLWSGVPARTVADQVESSTVMAGYGLTPHNLGSGGYSTSQWVGGFNIRSALELDKYFHFNVRPKSGESLDLAALYIPVRHTEGAPHSIALIYSFDGFSTYSVVDTRQMHDQASGTTLTRHLFVLSDNSDLTNLTEEVEFGIVGLGAKSAGSTFALFNDEGGDDMILFAGSSDTQTISGTGGSDVWYQVNARIRAEAHAAADSLFTGWSGDAMNNQSVLENLELVDPLSLTAHFETDSVGDGIPDSWKLHYFGDLAAGAAGEDPDGDGFSNLEEYQRGTNPIVADEALSVDSIYLSRWENTHRDPDLPGNWAIHDFGSGFRGARESSNQNRSALNPFHPDGIALKVTENLSYDGPRMIVREDAWDPAWKDGVYETVISVGDDDGNTFFFRYQDELNWYRVVISGEHNNAANRPISGVHIHKRIDGEYEDSYITTGSMGTDPTDDGFYKRVKVRIKANGPEFEVEVSGWDQTQTPPRWKEPGEHGYASLYFYDDGLKDGRAGIGTWAQGGGFQDDGPDWNPVNVGTLFESFTVEHDGETVFSEDWSDFPAAGDLPADWENPFAEEDGLAGSWRNSAHGTIVQTSSDGDPTNAVGTEKRVDADGPTLLAPAIESSTYLLELGFHPFNSGAIGFVFDYVDADNYGRVLFSNSMQIAEGGMPKGVSISRKQAGSWSEILVGDESFIPRLGQPIVATLSRSGSGYVLNVQEVDHPDSLHRWEWEDTSAPSGIGRYGVTSWQMTNAHFLFADAYGVISTGDDSDLAVLAIEKIGETIRLTVHNPSGEPYKVQRIGDLSSGNWETVDENQTDSEWSGSIPAGADRMFWRLTR